MLTEPFYDPARSYLENFEQGPFSFFAEQCVYQDHGEPRYKFLGHEVNLPLGIAAGPLLNGRFVKAALDKGFRPSRVQDGADAAVCVACVAECAGGASEGRFGT